MDGDGVATLDWGGKFGFSKKVVWKLRSVGQDRGGHIKIKGRSIPGKRVQLVQRPGGRNKLVFKEQKGDGCDWSLEAKTDGGQDRRGWWRKAGD